MRNQEIEKKEEKRGSVWDRLFGVEVVRVWKDEGWEMKVLWYGCGLGLLLGGLSRILHPEEVGTWRGLLIGGLLGVGCYLTTLAVSYLIVSKRVQSTGWPKV